MAIELLVLVGATVLFLRDIRRGAGLYLFAALLAVFVGHSLAHLLQALALRTYTPGLITVSLASWSARSRSRRCCSESWRWGGSSRWSARPLEAI
jgi:hypothetical protein